LEINEKLGAFEVAGSHTDIVLCSSMIEFSQTPVNQAELQSHLLFTISHNTQTRTNLTLLVVNHDIVGLHVPVHYSARVTKVQGLEELKHVVADVVVC
jgi:hypothetical protein